MKKMFKETLLITRYFLFVFREIKTCIDTINSLYIVPNSASFRLYKVLFIVLKYAHKELEECHSDLLNIFDIKFLLLVSSRFHNFFYIFREFLAVVFGEFREIVLLLGTETASRRK